MADSVEAKLAELDAFDAKKDAFDAKLAELEERPKVERKEDFRLGKEVGAAAARGALAFTQAIPDIAFFLADMTGGTGGLPAEEFPGTSASLIKALGIPESKADSFGERAIVNTTEFVSSGAVPVGKILSAANPRNIQALKGATGFIPRAQKAVLEGVASSPGRFVAAETAAATGAATAVAAVQGQTDDPVALFMANLAGSFTPSGATRAAGLAGRAVGKPVKMLSGKSQNQRAGEILTEFTTGELEAFDEAGRIPALQSDDPGIDALTIAASADNANTRGVVEGQVRDLSSSSRDSIPGSTSDTANFFQREVDETINRINDRGQQAVLRAEREMAALDRANATEASQVARKHLEDALVDAENAERQVWANVPPSGQPTPPLKSKTRELVAKQPITNNPALLNKTINGIVKDIENLPGAVSGSDYVALRSRILAAKRATEGGNPQTREGIAFLNELQGIILDELDATAQASTPVGIATRAALDVSREVDDKFRKRSVGRILGYSLEGSLRVVPELTIGSFGSREAGRQKALEILRAAPEAREALKDFVRAEFAHTTTKTGKVSQSSMNTFLANNKELLQELGMTEELSNIASAQSMASRILEQNKRLKHRVERSKAAMFIQKDPDKAVASALTGPDSVQAMKSLANRARRDPEALQGLKRGIYQAALGTDEIIDGRKMRAFLRKNRGAILQVMDPNEYARMEQMSHLLERAYKLTRSGGRLDVKPEDNVLVNSAARVLGTKVGPQVGIGGLVGAGISSRLAKAVTNALQDVDTVKQIVEDAVINPKLWNALTMKAESEGRKKVRLKVLHTHLVNSGYIQPDPSGGNSLSEETN